MTLLDFLQDHISEGGDGLNFKGVTWTAAAKLLEASRTKGAPKNALATKNKFANLKETYFVVDALNNVSGFKWDEENGADIDGDTLPVWNTYVDRFPKAKRFKKKGWPHYFAVQAMIPAVARLKGANVFQPLQDPPDDDSDKQEDHGEKGEPEENVGDENIDWPPSDDESMLDPVLRANSKPVNAPIIAPIIAPIDTTTDDAITARLPTGTPLAPLSLHRRKYSALIASGSGSAYTTSPSSTPGPSSAKRRHVSKPELPALDPEAAAISERIDNFTEAFRVATGTATTGLEASPIRKCRAIRSAQELEEDLSDSELVSLVNIFRSDVGAADTYLELKHQESRKA